MSIWRQHHDSPTAVSNAGCGGSVMSASFGRADVALPLAAVQVKCYLPRPDAKRRCVHPGPVAHLVERFHGMEEVVGSSPIGST